jgi:hypothetical protein
VRSLGELGRDTIKRPDTLPGKAGGWIKRWLAKIWNVRGGGLYACGYIVTFVFFEIKMIIGDITESSGVGDFLQSQITEFFIRFFTDTLQNMIKAFMWPVYVIQLHPMFGGIALGLAFVLFPKYLKKPIEKWLFG